ncbi:TspO/MBR family protein [Nesterenkonia alkaliphila]|uniref:Tryptophan-rich sensory protein n=1 Tax=Nesterenkonia alkaliphila TaxID=1463631 RepID=A0A7K1UKP7_9MICC|nr:TspO/MBR family protein [Nesterenkonia alkaliphila]MVT27039.1 tryptophan-rich sensory protein [Nesterenkonia alkaliphila]GFZ93967.1 putative TspO/MBR-related protein precursor [Nesterenkonia alkaliphila]
MASQTRTIQVLGLAVMIAVPLLVGFLGSQATSEHTDGWYSEAEVAPWNPPSWVFSPVWTTLYIMMGVAAWLVWRHRHAAAVRTALGLYLAQLVLNGLWTPLFFAGYPAWGTAALWGAMAVILGLILVLALTIRAFWPISRLAAVLLLPYLGWVAYAASLNLYIAIAN